MERILFAASPCGRVVRTRTGYHAYVPAPLPPSLRWRNDTARGLERAGLAIGALDACLNDLNGHHLPLLLRADAVGAIRSEGRRIDITGLLSDEARGVFKAQNSRLAAGYADAFEHGRTRLEEFPLSLRLIRELHHHLLIDIGDPRTTPGQFRRTQNWMGPPGCTLSSADFVPPPPGEMDELLDNWEHYLHQSDDTVSLVRLAIAHYQFMVIHPLLSMNGATAALLCPLLLQPMGVTSTAIPFFGQFIASHATSLQQRMLAVCTSGCWEDWLTWYLHGIADAAHQALLVIRRLHGLEQEWHVQVQMVHEADAQEVRRVLDHLLRTGVTTTGSAASETGITADAAEAAMHTLVSLGAAAPDYGNGDGLFWSPEVIAVLNAPSLL